MIFRAVGDGRPYPTHGLESARDWADVPPRMVRLDELITTKRNLDLATLLSEESTFYGDLFAHVVQWQDKLYLEDGLHRPCGQPFSNVQPCMPACWCWTDRVIPLD